MFVIGGSDVWHITRPIKVKSVPKRITAGRQTPCPFAIFTFMYFSLLTCVTAINAPNNSVPSALAHDSIATVHIATPANGNKLLVKFNLPHLDIRLVTSSPFGIDASVFGEGASLLAMSLLLVDAIAIIVNGTMPRVQAAARP